MSAFAFPANAQEEPIIKEPPVITNKWNSTQNRLEIALFPYDLTIRNLYVRHPWAAHASLGYHFFDWLGVEGFGGYVFMKGDSVTTEILKSVSGVKDFQLAGLWRTAWFAGGNILWAPFYGKLSLVSEVEGTFQIYALLGAGAEGIERPTQTEGTLRSTRFSVNVGGGLRLFLTKSLALRAEVRESLGKNAFLSGEQGEIQGSTWCQFGVSLFL